MLRSGMIDMTRVERIALDQLLLQEGEKASVGRADPGEQGPLVVKYPDKQFLIDAEGKVSRG